MLIRNDGYHLNILAWSVPDIDVKLHDPPALLGTTLSTRVALSFKREDPIGSGSHFEIIDIVMAGLPLDGLVMLAAQDLDRSTSLARYLSTQQFWLRHSPKWPLLRRVRLAPPVDCGFVEMLSEDIGGRESPLLPSLTELVLVDGELSPHWTHWLCRAFKKRVEKGVPLQILDLRAYDHRYDPADLRLLSKIVVDVLGPVYIDSLVPEKKLDTSGKTMSRMWPLWRDLACGHFPFLQDGDEDENGDE